MNVIPDLPGNLVPYRSEFEAWLKQHVATICRLDHDRFPGSQPVSFGFRDLEKLEKQDFFVCEKSDGVRVLVLIILIRDTQEQQVFIIDRHNTYRELQGFVFPHWADPKQSLGDTLFDGELVVDVDPKTKKQTLRLLAFDCLVVDGVNVMEKYLSSRIGRLNEWLIRPYRQMLQEYPDMASHQPFEIKLKENRNSYNAETVFNEDIPRLRHGNDGLIYTAVNAPYTPGTDSNILKWKPPSENSIDFKLVLRFPPNKDDPSSSDLYAKPVFQLHVWCGDERGVPKFDLYDLMHVTDDEWTKMKLSGEQIDDRIVEVHWDPSDNHWRIMRFRNDKPKPNHRSVVENIIQSIADGIEKDVLLGRTRKIREAWKTRNSSAAVPPKPPSQRPPLQIPHPLKLPLRYGPFAKPMWSKVGGPDTVLGFKR